MVEKILPGGCFQRYRLARRCDLRPMLTFISTQELLHHAGSLFLPHRCPGCSNRLSNATESICLRCLSTLPATGYFHQVGNPVERLFWGRAKIDAAGSLFYFSRGSTIQRMLHALKYHGNRSVGRQLGSMLGGTLKRGTRFHPVDAIIPIPLHAARLRQRGYNQAACIAHGLSESTAYPVWEDLVIRVRQTETQTRKSRVDRWDNLAGGFRLRGPDRIKDRHLLLVDDVITTGASLEACATAIIEAAPASLRIATIAYATH